MIPLPVRSPFGLRRHPVTGQMHEHQGIDIPMPTGIAVFACVSGRVSRIDADGLGKGIAHGNAVFVRASSGQTWIYMHLSKVYVGLNQLVPRGQKIGAVGATGQVTGPHLHLQVLDAQGVAINPVPLFPAGSFVRV